MKDIKKHRFIGLVAGMIIFSVIGFIDLNNKSVDLINMFLSMTLVIFMGALVGTLIGACFDAICCFYNLKELGE